jgi:hypothetical protein
VNARVEARYLAPRLEPAAIREALSCGWRCLEYCVSNYYLDGAEGEFSQIALGSPRLRLRLYEAGQYRFGQLERKRQLTAATTQKEVWPAHDVWALLAQALPWLSNLTLREPPPGDPLAVLLSEDATGASDLRTVRCIGSLAYRRLSCARPGARLTADWQFEPPIVAPSTMIVETKCDGGKLEPETLRRLALEPLAASKYGLLRTVAA